MVKEQGGLQEIAKRNYESVTTTLPGAIDNSDFYINHVMKTAL